MTDVAERPASADLAPDAREALAELLLTVADDEFVIGFWDSEWTGIAPMLEEDVATSSIAQDEIGHARALYEMLAELTSDDPDRIAFGRDADEFRHAALLEHARGDWAFSVARRWLYETADAVRLSAIAESAYAPLSALATKMRREETYHRLHADAWLRRLADGAPEGRERLADALRRLWPDAAQVFAPLEHEASLVEHGFLTTPMADLHAAWEARIGPEVTAIAGELAAASPAADGRRHRTDDFRWLHAEFTSVARSEEGAAW